MADGRRATREVVEHDDVVAVVPLLENGDLLLVRQYRLPTQLVMLEVPAGGVDRGETPEQAAQRELAEEIDRRAGRLQRLCGFYVSPGFCDEYVHVFLATELEEASLPHDADEDLEVVRMPLAEAVRLVYAGEIQDSKSIIGLLWTAKVRGVTIEHT